MDSARVRRLGTNSVQPGGYVLYWMQSAQRVENNEALCLAVEKANDLNCPLVVCFGLVGRYLGASARQYTFMCSGLTEVSRALADRGIGFVVRAQSPEALVLDLAQDARCVVLDRGYLRTHTRWYRWLAARLPCAAWQVETNVVVPVESASGKDEYAARTFRPRVNKLVDRYLVQPVLSDLKMRADRLEFSGLETASASLLMTSIGLAPNTTASLLPRGGESAAHARLAAFVEEGLDQYDEKSSDPACSGQSGLSPYLHFGQISPVEVALRVREAGGPSADAFLEQLIVRRELAINMVHHAPGYDSLGILPAWAVQTLMTHASDPRPVLYSLSDLEAGDTHDPYWNAAQRELLLTGTMHGYLRMYWGKKILEWSPTPASALERILYLNDGYELDGRDPNGYAGAAWCLGKHDQAWAERPIFGKVRYMNARGLERKFDVQAYVARVAALDQESGSGI